MAVSGRGMKEQPGKEAGCSDRQWMFPYHTIFMFALYKSINATVNIFIFNFFLNLCISIDFDSPESFSRITIFQIKKKKRKMKILTVAFMFIFNYLDTLPKLLA